MGRVRTGMRMRRKLSNFMKSLSVVVMYDVRLCARSGLTRYELTGRVFRPMICLKISSLRLC